MPDPIRMQEFGCDELSFGSKLGKGDFDLVKFAQILSGLRTKIKGTKQLPTKKTTRLPIYFAINPTNRATDCHLHVLLSKGERKDELNLTFTLHPIKKRPPPPPEDFSMERIHSVFGSVVPRQLRGVASASYSYSAPPYKTIIPLPHTGIIPLESSLVRKSSVSGVEFTIEESDIGLREVFISTSPKNRITLVAWYRFTHDLNYGLFTRLAEYAARVSSLFVLKAEKE